VIDLVDRGDNITEPSLRKVLRPRWAAGTYMSLTAMTERADWVTELGVARKSLRRGSLGKKKLQLILSEFPTSFKKDYDRDSAAMFKRLASLVSDKRKGITKRIAETLCTNLFGVATEHATKGTSLLVTPEACRDVANNSAVSAVAAKRRFFPS
jgi:hypothetical protein